MKQLITSVLVDRVVGVMTVVLLLDAVTVAATIFWALFFQN